MEQKNSKEGNVLQPINEDQQADSGNVKVVCRVRPLNKRETAKGDQCCLDFLKGGK